MTAAERCALPGVSPRRGPQLLAGAMVADAVMDLLDVGQLHICPWALREGVILRWLDGFSAAGGPSPPPRWTGEPTDGRLGAPAR
jgi:exopolyphosphatase / guanosine-5'-triphosphate,3'-diphosphate pyrophosphatase